MPTLEWIGKDKVVNHHQEVPYRVLERQYSYDEQGQHEADNGSENMIIHGDNLEALKALLPMYEGKVKCIYIDPPYNTGNEGWVYNDNVNDPKIKKWLGEVVGKEGEDLSRHDKWLCMMYPRLKLLQKLLAEDGAIFISIDDNELYNLKSICDEIFGANCFVSDISWQRVYCPRNDSQGVPNEVDHILVYSRFPDWNPIRLERTSEMDQKYSAPDGDDNDWTSAPAHAPGAATHTGMVYAIQHPITGELMYPPVGRCWTYGQDKMLMLMNEWNQYELRDIDDYAKRKEICRNADKTPEKYDAIMLVSDSTNSLDKSKQRYEEGNWPILYFTSKGTGGMRCKKYLCDMPGKVVTNLWHYSEVGHTDEASKELKKIFDGRVVFDTPKPERLINRIIKIVSGKKGIILDSFAGSGTTAHAVLNMNKSDGGDRKFILIETEAYADDITAERVKRVISGYKADREDVLYDEEITEKNLANGAEMLAEAKEIAKNAKDQYSTVKKPKIEDGHLRVVGIQKSKDIVAGLGGSFSYYELGSVLLHPDGNLNEEVGTQKIREYVYYMETKEPIPTKQPVDEPYFMGKFRNTAYYFYYEPGAVTTLDYRFLATVKTPADGYTIYADLCVIPLDDLRKKNITFKKIPRDIARL